MYLRQPAIKPNFIKYSLQMAESLQEIEGSSGSCTRAYIAALRCPQANPTNSSKPVFIIEMMLEQCRL